MTHRRARPSSSAKRRRRRQSRRLITSTRSDGSARRVLYRHAREHVAGPTTTPPRDYIILDGDRVTTTTTNRANVGRLIRHRPPCPFKATGRRQNVVYATWRLEKRDAAAIGSSRARARRRTIARPSTLAAGNLSRRRLPAAADREILTRFCIALHIIQQTLCPPPPPPTPRQHADNRCRRRRIRNGFVRLIYGRTVGNNGSSAQRPRCKRG